METKDLEFSKADEVAFVLFNKNESSSSYQSSSPLLNAILREFIDKGTMSRLLL